MGNECGQKTGGEETPHIPQEAVSLLSRADFLPLSTAHRGQGSYDGVSYMNGYRHVQAGKNGTDAHLQGHLAAETDIRISGIDLRD